MLINTYSRKTGVSAQIDDSLLEKREGVDKHENANTAWVEYWKDGECVHRSAHVAMQKLPEGMEEVGKKLFG